MKQEDQHQAIAAPDITTGHVWRLVVRTNGYFGDEDYDIVIRFDNGIGQAVFVASGVTTFGTEAAARYLVEPADFLTPLKNAPADWYKKELSGGDPCLSYWHDDRQHHGRHYPQLVRLSFAGCRWPPLHCSGLNPVQLGDSNDGNPRYASPTSFNLNLVWASNSVHCEDCRTDKHHARMPRLMDKR